MPKEGFDPLRIGLIPNCDPSGLSDFNERQSRDTRLLSDLFGGNSGNLAYVEGTRRLVAGSPLMFSWTSDIDWVHANVDQIVVCCANQLGPHTDLSVWAERLSLFDKPVSLIGLGAQAPSAGMMPTIQEGTLKFLNVVKCLAPSTSPNIATRGVFSTAVLEQLGYSSVPAGCPSILIRPGETIATKIKERLSTRTPRVAVGAGNPWVDESTKLEQILVSFLSASSRGYIVQHPDQLLSLAIGDERGLSGSDITTITEWLQPQLKGISLMEWFNENSRLFLTLDDWLQALEEFDLVVGTRFHGVCLGVQAGLMGTVISIDSRTQELCETTGIKCFSLAEANTMSRDELLARARWGDADIVHLLTKQKQVARDLSIFFQSNGLEASAHARSLNGWQH